MGRQQRSRADRRLACARARLLTAALCLKGINHMTDVETNTPVWLVVIAWAALLLILNVLGVFTAAAALATAYPSVLTQPNDYAIMLPASRARVSDPPPT
jgi:hypothetical protein